MNRISRGAKGKDHKSKTAADSNVLIKVEAEEDIEIVELSSFDLFKSDHQSVSTTTCNVDIVRIPADESEIDIKDEPIDDGDIENVSKKL